MHELFPPHGSPITHLSEKSTIIKFQDVSGRHFEFSSVANVDKIKNISSSASCNRRNCFPIKNDVLQSVTISRQ